MEEAITKFLDGMERQERSGFKDLHRFLGRLPLPVVKGDRAMLHFEALEGGFIPKMVLRWMRRNRKDSHRQNYSCTYMHWNTYIVHTRAFLFIQCIY
jgi:hypothetical protein